MTREFIRICGMQLELLNTIKCGVLNKVRKQIMDTSIKLCEI